jgi:hypothetical protein
MRHGIHGSRNWLLPATIVLQPAASAAQALCHSISWSLVMLANGVPLHVQVGIRVIIALTNHEPTNGGTQW